MVGALHLFVRVLLSSAVLTQAGKVTPMEKVMSLLKDLSAKVTAEGKKEAAQYDKYACFCKEQADEKLYAIEKSEARIADLKAKIKELDTAIAQLNSEISDLSKKISALETTINENTEKRDTEHGEYLAKAKDMNEAIEACGAAIAAFKDSKAALKGAKLDFVQIQRAAAGLVGVISRQPLLATAPGAVALLAHFGDRAAPKFQYQSNDIIATLESLLATFKSMKKDLDIEEFDINSAFESKKLGDSNEKKFAEKEKAEKQAIVEAKTEELEAAKTDKDEETNDMNADQTFLDELTKECEEKASLFDQRSKTRSQELSAMSDALAKLEKGAVPNFEANKKLVGIQKKTVVVKASALVSAPTFVQIANVRNHYSGEQVVLKKVLDMLHAAVGRTGSVSLASVEARVKVAEDHFVKVRALIKDLMAKLKADALDEASQKSVCDTGMAKAVADRDEAQGKIEIATAKITTLTAKKNDLKDQIATMNKEISELKKALLEATELRAEDKAENTKTVAMSDDGIDAVKLALSILQNFYKDALLVQTKKYVPPKSDREGNTVGDLAPEVFDDKYHGAQKESKGIIGVLEVILSDFERTHMSTKKEEKLSKEAFETFEKDTNNDVAKKEGKIKTLEGDLSDTESDILDQEKNLADAKDLLASGLQALEGLEAMCVKGEETWEERKKKREEEIDALKDALAILEDWQK